jgi:hypothetical protein
MDEALAKCVATEGAFTCIDRNFIKWKGFFPFPIRSWRKMGDPVSKYPKIINPNRIGLKIKMPKKEKSISKKRIIDY